MTRCERLVLEALFLTGNLCLDDLCRQVPSHKRSTINYALKELHNVHKTIFVSSWGMPPPGRAGLARYPKFSACPGKDVPKPPMPKRRQKTKKKEAPEGLLTAGVELPVTPPAPPRPKAKFKLHLVVDTPFKTIWVGGAYPGEAAPVHH